MSSDDESSVDLSLLSEGSDGDEPGQQVPRGAGKSGSGDSDGDGGGGAAERRDAQGPGGGEAGGNGGASGGDGGGGSGGGVGGGEAKPKNKKKKLSKVLSAEKLRRLKEKVERRGIVYVSRIPPHMKPAKLRQLLSQYGEVGRVYCTPEDAALRRKRKQHGGNTGARRAGGAGRAAGRSGRARGGRQGAGRLALLRSRGGRAGVQRPAASEAPGCRSVGAPAQGCLGNPPTHQPLSAPPYNVTPTPNPQALSPNLLNPQPPGKNFTEGWVEFEDKAVAKSVAAAAGGAAPGGTGGSGAASATRCRR